VAALSVSVVAIAAIADGPDDDRAIGFAGDVPSDVRALATDTWQGFDEAFAAQRDCYDPPTIAVAWSMEDRGRYDPATATVTIRVPWTAANLEAALVHEFAHHVEFTCEDHAAMRTPFLGAMEVPADTPWLEGGDWASTPSERWAEAAVVVVLGSPPHVTASPREAEVAVVADWADG
jgi:hypothetical protein